MKCLHAAIWSNYPSSCPLLSSLVIAALQSALSRNSEHSSEGTALEKTGEIDFNICHATRPVLSGHSISHPLAQPLNRSTTHRLCHKTCNIYEWSPRDFNCGNAKSASQALMLDAGKCFVVSVYGIELDPKPGPCWASYCLKVPKNS